MVDALGQVAFGLPATVAPARPATFATVWDEGFTMLVDGTPRLRGVDVLVSTDEIVVACARLDRRPSGLPAVAPRASDAEMACRAYLHWGRDVGLHLEGDWWLAAWHRRQRRLRVVRDPIGVTALFIACDSTGAAFATDLRLLLGLPWVSHTLDDDWLVYHLVNAPSDNDIRTPFRAIQAVPPGHFVEIDAAGARATSYWPLPGTRLSDQTRTESVRVLRETFVDAVTRRMPIGGEVAVALSAGLDSGAVAAVASAVSAHRGVRVQPFTHVPSVAGFSRSPKRGLFNELAGASELAHFLGLPPPVQISGDDMPPIRALREKLRVVGAPAKGTRNSSWIFSLLHAVRARGISVLLTGQLGNLVFSWDGLPLSTLDHMRVGNLRSAGRRVLPWQIRQWYHYSRLRKANSAFPSSPIALDLARDHPVARRLAEERHTPEWYGKPFEPRRRQLARVGALSGTSWARVGAATGVEMRDPGADRSLVDACLAIPDRNWQVPGSRYLNRGLFRDAMADLLPSPTRLRRERGVQAADIGYRLSAQPGELLEALDEAESSVLARRYVNLDLLRGLAADTITAPQMSNLSVVDDTLLGGLETALFLGSVEHGWARVLENPVTPTPRLFATVD